MKFSEITYKRPDPEAVKAKWTELTKALGTASSYEQARKVFLDKEGFTKSYSTMQELSGIRHSIDTRDEFYDAENDFWDAFTPELQQYEQEFKDALLASSFRRQLSEEFGELMFINAELAQKAFSPEIVPELKRENELESEYEKLLASARIPFEGGVYTLSEMSAFNTLEDDDRRLAAWKATGEWYASNAEKLDAIYDELVKLRDLMGRKLGYDGYTQLGYCRMMRNCYTKQDVETFRQAVRDYIVPIASKIRMQQAKRIGKSYPLSYADCALFFRSGNPRPQGSAEDIVAEAGRFYDALSPETSEFFRMMRESELMDLESREGKQGGGYCTGLPEYEVPFIFANFNGTQGDVEVVTHEAGHAFAHWLSRKRVPAEYAFPSMEACEVHSMSMEFFAWRNVEGFFGRDAKKFMYSHLSDALTFIPYGTMVDHFQHIVYEHPELTSAQRHEEWKRLTGIYMPWIRLDGEIPFFSEGRYWQRQSHIYSDPFYYIDYCLAQTVALQFWALMRRDPDKAWERYMAYTIPGGSRTFTELLEGAGLKTPFDPACLVEISKTAAAWIVKFDMSGIE